MDARLLLRFALNRENRQRSFPYPCLVFDGCATRRLLVTVWMYRWSHRNCFSVIQKETGCRRTLLNWNEYTSPLIFNSKSLHPRGMARPDFCLALVMTLNFSAYLFVIKFVCFAISPRGGWHRKIKWPTQTEGEWKPCRIVVVYSWLCCFYNTDAMNSIPSIRHPQ